MQLKDLNNLNNANPASGRLLVSDPFLPDPNFKRTVVLLTEHREEGSVGFVLNKPMKLSLQDVMQLDTEERIPLYEGGPVQKDTLHIVHRVKSIGQDDLEISKGVYWGANYEAVKSYISQNGFDPSLFRFFLGYSGWGGGQLDLELEHKSWIVTKGSQKVIFSPNSDALWKNVLKQFGGNLSFLANFPEDPSLN